VDRGAAAHCAYIFFLLFSFFSFSISGRRVSRIFLFFSSAERANPEPRSMSGLRQSPSPLFFPFLFFFFSSGALFFSLPFFFSSRESARRERSVRPPPSSFPFFFPKEKQIVVSPPFFLLFSFSSRRRGSRGALFSPSFFFPSFFFPLLQGRRGRLTVFFSPLFSSLPFPRDSRVLRLDLRPFFPPSSFSFRQVGPLRPSSPFFPSPFISWMR